MSAKRREEDAPARPDLGQLETLLGYTFADRALLARALVHGSAAT